MASASVGCESSETAAQLFARLSSRPTLKDIECKIFDQSRSSIHRCIEFFGKDSCGKTEILLHLIIKTIMPIKWNGYNIYGKESAVLLIDLDYKFPMIRMISLLEQQLLKTVKKETLLEEQEVDSSPSCIESFVQCCLERFFKINCSSTTELFVTLHSLHIFFNENPDIILLLIDNTASFYSLDWNESNTYKEYIKQTSMLINVLKSLMDNYNFMIVLTRLSNFTVESDKHDRYSVWNDLVKQRFHLVKEVVTTVDEHIYCCKSISLKPYSIRFLVTEKGIEFL